MRSLAEQRAALQARLDEVEQERARLADDTVRLEQRLAEVHAEAQRMRREGKRAFAEELMAARREVAKAIEAAKGGADARTLNATSHQLQELDQRTLAGAPDPGEPARPATVSVGDAVEVELLPGTRLTVAEVDGDDIVLARGAVKMRVKREALRAPSTETKPPKKRK